MRKRPAEGAVDAAQDAEYGAVQPPAVQPPEYAVTEQSRPPRFQALGPLSLNDLDALNAQEELAVVEIHAHGLARAVERAADGDAVRADNALALAVERDGAVVLAGYLHDLAGDVGDGTLAVAGAPVLEVADGDVVLTVPDLGALFELVCDVVRGLLAVERDEDLLRVGSGALGTEQLVAEESRRGEDDYDYEQVNDVHLAKESAFFVDHDVPPKCLLICAVDVPGQLLEVEFLRDLAQGVRRELPIERLVLHEPVDGPGKARRVAVFDDKTAANVRLREVAVAADVGHDEGQRAVHGLEDCEAHRLVAAAGVEVEVGRAEDAVRVVPIAGLDHDIAEPELRRLLLDGVKLLAVAAYDAAEGPVRELFELREGVEQEKEPLFRRIAREDGEHELALAYAELRTDGHVAHGVLLRLHAGAAGNSAPCQGDGLRRRVRMGDLYVLHHRGGGGLGLRGFRLRGLYLRQRLTGNGRSAGGRAVPHGHHIISIGCIRGQAGGGVARPGDGGGHIAVLIQHPVAVRVGGSRPCQGNGVLGRAAPETGDGGRGLGLVGGRAQRGSSVIVGNVGIAGHADDDRQAAGGTKAGKLRLHRRALAAPFQGLAGRASEQLSVLVVRDLDALRRGALHKAQSSRNGISADAQRDHGHVYTGDVSRRGLHVKLHKRKEKDDCQYQAQQPLTMTFFCYFEHKTTSALFPICIYCSTGIFHCPAE